MDNSIYIHGSQPDEQQRLSKLNKMLNQACMQVLQPKEGERILDVGSGLGQFTRAMAKRAGIKALGIERDIQQLHAAKDFAKADQEEHLVDFRQGDANDLPLLEEEVESFDLVHCRFVLEHVKHPDKVMDQMILGVKKGGRVVICDDDHSTFTPTPTPFGFKALWEAYIRSYDRLGNDPFVGRRLVELMHTAGLTQIRNQLVFFGGCAYEEKFELVADNLIGILSGAKGFMLAEHLIDERTFDQGMAGLAHWRKQKDAALWYAIPWAEGWKK
jgi:ubiquinone/menaquinone biosynthesis C-methylase UbiE